MITKVLITAFAAGLIYAGGFIAGGQVTEGNEFHTECFAVEWSEEGTHGEAVDCKRGHAIDGEGIFITHDVMAHYEPIEGGDVVRIQWTLQQAEQSDWATPAKIERNDGK